MSQRRKIIYRSYKWQIATAGERVVRDFEIDSKVKEIIGLRIDSPLTERATVKIEISNSEVVGDGFPARILDFSNGATKRFFDDFFITAEGKKGSINPGNLRLKVEYTDVPPTGGVPPLVPHEVYLTIQCITNE